MVATDHEIRERFVRRMKLGANAAARQPEVRQRDIRQECPSRLQERFDRQPIAFVIVLPALEPRGRPDPYVARRGRRQVHAEAVARCMG